MFTTELTACGLWPLHSLLSGAACCKPSWSSPSCTARLVAWNRCLCKLDPVSHPCGYGPESRIDSEVFWWCNHLHKMTMKTSLKCVIFHSVPSIHVHIDDEIFTVLWYLLIFVSNCSYKIWYGGGDKGSANKGEDSNKWRCSQNIPTVSPTRGWFWHGRRLLWKTTKRPLHHDDLIN